MLADDPVFPILLSKDLARRRAFAEGVLGLDVIRADEERVVFRCAGATQVVVTRSTVGTSDTQTQAAWRVPDLKAELAELRARGVRIEDDVAPDPPTTDGIADMGFAWPPGSSTRAVTPSGMIEVKPPAGPPLAGSSAPD